MAHKAGTAGVGARCSDEEFIELWNKYKSATKLAQMLTLDVRGVHKRRKTLEARYGIQLTANSPIASKRVLYAKHPGRIDLGIENGTVIVFSDAHFWPSKRSTAFKGLLYLIEELKPKAVINNGDAFDGASISRHPRIGWDTTPSVIQELHACDAALSEIEVVAKKANSQVRLVWPLGNHDSRFETRLANTVPEYAHVKGFSLKDHFPAWEPCWACWPNESVVVKHRWKGGIHATHNNTVNAGVTIVTGHLHSLKVTPFADYNGNRFGVDTGTLADPDGDQFANYLELSPTNWRSGFIVLTFNNGHLLWPEIVHAIDENLIEFRGEVIDVSDF